jgi:uncharacterized protein YfaS (alpha-2-macroglobulin family)
LYLLARHFPERAARLGAADITAIADPIFNGAYTTYSSAWAILALETYARAATANTDGTLKVAQIVGGTAQSLLLPQNLLPAVTFSDQATAIRFSNSGQFDAYYVVGQRGFDQTLPTQPVAKKIEIFREYTGSDGKPLTTVKLGDEIQVHVRLRALEKDNIDQIAVVDLLPGGFEPVIQLKAKKSDADKSEGETPASEGKAEGEAHEGEAHEEGEGNEGEGNEGESATPDEGETGSGTGVFALPIALPESTFVPTFGDVREDRVVLYGSAHLAVKELIYVIRATNTGKFTVAPIMADAMYDRSVVGHGVAGQIVVTAK